MKTGMAKEKTLHCNPSQSSANTFMVVGVRLRLLENTDVWLTSNTRWGGQKLTLLTSGTKAQSQNQLQKPGNEARAEVTWLLQCP